MAWPKFGKSEEKPPEGQSNSEADELIEKFSAAVDAKLKPLADSFNTLQTEWSAIKQAAEKQDEPPPKPDSELTPEQIALRDRNNLLALSVATNARITESECIQGISGQWSNLIPQIRDIFARTPIQRKAQADYPEYCANVVDMTVGKAARAAGLRSDGKTFFIEDSASKSGGEESPLNQFPTWHGDDRTETASETLAKLKIDPKKFAEDLAAGRLN